MERSKTARQPPKVPLRPQIKLCEFLKGMGLEVGYEELRVVGYLFPYMKYILRKKLKSVFKCQVKTSGPIVLITKKNNLHIDELCK